MAIVTKRLRPLMVMGLDGNSFKLARFSEVLNNGKLVWYFFADQCRASPRDLSG